MTGFPLAITGVGMVTGVGLNAPASCAAIRCAIDNFQETRFMDSGGEWIIGSNAPLDQPWRGIARLTKMLASALKECAESVPGVNMTDIPVLICTSEKDRPGRFHDLEQALYAEVQRELGIRFNEGSDVIAAGRVGIGVALNEKASKNKKARIKQNKRIKKKRIKKDIQC